MNERVLCVAAHPDDEALGCGGTLARHQAVGDDITVLFMTDGVSSRGTYDGLKARREAARKANAGREVIFCDFQDNRMDRTSLLNVAQEIERAVKLFSPTIVYTHWHGDLNIDHQLTSRATQTACRPLPSSTVRGLYYFEALSSTEWAPGPSFAPSRFVAVDLQEKLAALECYADEMRGFPHPRSTEGVTALAMMRGAMCGRPAAEAFVVGRSIA